MKNEIIKDFAQHIFNLGLSYGSNIMPLEEVEKYKWQMIDAFCVSINDHQDQPKEEVKE
jgi:predicted metalloprotease with PDZ domain